MGFKVLLLFVAIYIPDALVKDQFSTVVETSRKKISSCSKHAFKCVKKENRKSTQRGVYINTERAGSLKMLGVFF